MNNPHMEPEVVVPCPECEGDGKQYSGFYFRGDHSVTEDITPCTFCGATGWIETDPAGEDHLDIGDEK